VSVYHIDEASLDIPEDWKDLTVHIWSAAAADQTGIGLVVGRDRLDGITLEEYVEKHLRAQAQRLRSYLLISKRPFTLASLPAIEAKLQWLHDAGGMFHHQVYVEYYDKVVTFTMSSFLKNAKDCEPMMSRVLASVRWRRR
jgi:hypothetical protein